MKGRSIVLAFAVCFLLLFLGAARADVIFNTVPAPVLGEEELRHVRLQCVLIDLSSAPYGIDRDAAEALGLKAFLESGLPGRYCPLSAAETLLNYMEREGSA